MLYLAKKYNPELVIDFTLTGQQWLLSLRIGELSIKTLKKIIELKKSGKCTKDC